MKKRNHIRLVIQIFFFVFVGLIAINKGLSEIGKSFSFLPELSLHAICPFGGIETLYSTITLGQTVKKIHESSLVMMWLVFILTFLLGPVFCGWICPLGSIQEWISKIGKRIFKKKHNKIMPKKLDRWLRYLRYIVLLWVVYATAKSLTLVFLEFDPYYALFNFWTGEAAITSIAFLIIILLLSLIIERPWCKYLCPYGAVLGLFNKISIFKIRRNNQKCIGCQKCDNICPMNIEISKKETVKDTQCIKCMECTSEIICPIENTVYSSIGRSAHNDC